MMGFLLLAGVMVFYIVFIYIIETSHERYTHTTGRCDDNPYDDLPGDSRVSDTAPHLTTISRAHRRDDDDNDVIVSNSL